MGANALGQCKWAFDTPESCKAVSALNPFSSGGHPVYGNWAAMTNHFCGDASGCGWHGGKTCRSGPWTAADDGACVPESPPNLDMRLFKKAPTTTTTTPAPTPAPTPASMKFVGNCFFGHRTGQQMFADGYTYGGGGGSCGNGVTGKDCEGKCRDGCANNDHCLAYYYIDQTKLYGASALGQCVWAFDTPENCKAVSALNPFSSGGHPVYGNWAAMTNHFCGDASGCGWHGGKTCRSGPWTAADDGACVPESPPNLDMRLFKKAPTTTTTTPAPTPAPTPASMKFVGNCVFGHRTGQQMFADGYTYGGGGGSCGNGVTGKECEGKCRD